jgi:hypothetical protein
LTFQTVASVQKSGDVVAQQSSTRMQPEKIGAILRCLCSTSPPPCCGGLVGRQMAPATLGEPFRR